MPKGNSNAIVAVFSVLGLLAGILLTIFIKKYSAFGVSNTISIDINPFDVFSLIITVWIAIYIAKVLDKKNQSDSNGKAIVIDCMKSFGSDLTARIQSHLQGNELDGYVINSDFKILRKKLYNISDVVTKRGFLDSGNENIKELVSMVGKLWRLFTDVPRSANQGNQVNIMKPELRKLTIVQRSEIESTIVDCEKKVLEVIFDINNC